MSITFQRLRYKNFLSTGNVFTEINFQDAKTCLIVGKNGAGKTSFIDALVYVLYGKPYRPINKPQLVNSITQKGLLVEVEFEIGGKQYFVRRGQKPTVFEIYRQGTLLDQTTGVIEYQDLLEKQILKMSFRTFTQIVVLGSTNYVPFMRLPAYARREVVENLLDIQIFTVMNQLLKEKVNKNREGLTQLDYQLELAKDKLAFHQKQRKTRQENAAEKISQQEAEKQKNLDEITMLEVELKVSRNQLVQAEKIDKSRSEWQLISSQLYSKMTKLCDEIAFYQRHDNCPTCHQIITPEFTEKTVEAKGVEHRELEKAWKEVQQKLGGMANPPTPFIVAGIEQKQRKVLELQAMNKAIDKSLLELRIEQGPDDSEAEILKHSAEIEKLVLAQTELNDERKVLDTTAVLLKDGGIKTRIVQNYIPIINETINSYLEALDFFVSFTFDENFNETIKSRFRDTFSYESFSEGEKYRINLAILFAWLDLVKRRHSAACNLLIFDEVLDGSMDSDGLELVIEVFGGASDARHIFVISHQSTRLDKFEKVVEFKKVKNFSKMVA